MHTVRSALPMQSRVRRPIAVAAAFLVIAVDGSANPEPYGLGTAAQPAEVRAVDIAIMPDGRGLPDGQGSVQTGEAIYAASCSHCHGALGVGGPHGSLAGERLYRPDELAADATLKRTIGNYWPYATSLFDYLRRAMPFDKPGSLDNQSVYAVTAYLLYLNGLLDASATIDRHTLPEVQMPARPFFTPASKLDGGS